MTLNNSVNLNGYSQLTKKSTFLSEYVSPNELLRKYAEYISQTNERLAMNMG